MRNTKVGLCRQSTSFQDWVFILPRNVRKNGTIPSPSHAFIDIKVADFFSGHILGAVNGDNATDVRLSICSIQFEQGTGI